MTQIGDGLRTIIVEPLECPVELRKTGQSRLHRNPSWRPSQPRSECSRFHFANSRLACVAARRQRVEVPQWRAVAAQQTTASRMQTVWIRHARGSSP
jgi:hypothetical protein